MDSLENVKFDCISEAPVSQDIEGRIYRDADGKISSRLSSRASHPGDNRRSKGSQENPTTVS